MSDNLSKEEARIAAAMTRKPSAKSFAPKPSGSNQALEDVKRLAAEEQRAAAARLAATPAASYTSPAPAPAPQAFNPFAAPAPAPAPVVAARPQPAPTPSYTPVSTASIGAGADESLQREEERLAAAILHKHMSKPQFSTPTGSSGSSTALDEVRRKEEADRREKEEERKRRAAAEAAENAARRKAQEEEQKRRLEADLKKRQEQEWKTKALLSSLLTRPGRTMSFEWTESFDFDCIVFLEGTFTEWIQVPMTRTKGTHVFTVTINVPIGTHYYRFVENGKPKNDPKKPTGTDLVSGNICNKVVIDSVDTPPPTVDPNSLLSGLLPSAYRKIDQAKMNIAMNQLSFQTGTSLVAAPGATAKLSADEERRRRELEDARLKADAEFRAAEEKRKAIDAEIRAADERRRKAEEDFARVQREQEARVRVEAEQKAREAREAEARRIQQEEARRAQEEQRRKDEERQRQEQERLRVEAESRARQAKIEQEAAERIRRETEERARRAAEEQRIREEEIRKKSLEEAKRAEERTAQLKAEADERIRRNEAERKRLQQAEEEATAREQQLVAAKLALQNTSAASGYPQPAPTATAPALDPAYAKALQERQMLVAQIEEQIRQQVDAEVSRLVAQETQRRLEESYRTGVPPQPVIQDRRAVEDETQRRVKAALASLPPLPEPAPAPAPTAAASTPFGAPPPNPYGGSSNDPFAAAAQAPNLYGAPAAPASAPAPAPATPSPAPTTVPAPAPTPAMPAGIRPVMFKWEDNFEYDGRLQIAGTFSNWQPVPMSRSGDSHEFTIVLGLPPGVYFYKFIENGNWKNDPRQPQAVEPNSQQMCNLLQIQ